MPIEFKIKEANNDKDLGGFFGGKTPHYDDITFTSKGSTLASSWNNHFLKNMVISFNNTSPFLKIHPFYADYCKSKNELQIHVASGPTINNDVTTLILTETDPNEMKLEPTVDNVQVVFYVYAYHPVTNKKDLYFKDCKGNVKQISAYQILKNEALKMLNDGGPINPTPDTKKGSIIIGGQ